MFSILLGFEKKHLNAIELTSCVMHVFSGLMTMCLKASGNFSLPWKHYETYLTVVLGMFLIGLPLSFHYVLGFHIFILHFSKLSLMTGTIQSLNLIDTCIIPFSKCLYILFTLILSLELNLQIEFSKPRKSAQNIDTKLPQSPTTELLFTASGTSSILSFSNMYLFLT